MGRDYVYVKRTCRPLFNIVDSIGAAVFSIGNFLKRHSLDFEVKKIAVIELAHVGDVLAITPALRMLKERFPDASTTVVAGPWCKDILDGNPDINNVIVYRASWLDRMNKAPFSLSETVSFIRTMRSQRFDLCIDTRGDFRIILLMWLCGIKRRVGYGFAGGGFLLTDVKPFDVKRRQDRHQIEHNLKLIDFIDGGRRARDYDDKAPRIFFSDDDEAYIDNLLKERENGLLIAVHPGSGLPVKRWPVERFGLLIGDIVKRHKAKVLLLGGQEEKFLGEIIKSSTQAVFIDLIGKTSIKQLAALLKKCNLFVGGDSGVMHVASAVGTPIVAIWGGHNKPAHWGPSSEKDIILHSPQECSPCGLKSCKDAVCLKSIEVDEVSEAITKQIKRLEKK